MNTRMELTQTHTYTENTANLRTSVRQAVLKFIDRHADAFEALSRSTMPNYGTGLSATRSYAKIGQSNLAMRDQLNYVQAQVDELTKRVARLSDQINANAPVSSSVSGRRDIGINRFRSSRASF